MSKGLILGEALEVLIDHRGKTPKKLGGDFVENGIPVASAIMVKDGLLRLSEARYVDDDMFRRWMPVPVRRGDVLLTSEAPLGRVAVVRDDAPLVLGQRIFGLRGREGVLDSSYLYYVLQLPNVQSDLAGRSTGTTVSGIRQSALRSVAIPAPSYGEQKSIAEILRALDEKILVNMRVSDSAFDLGRSLLLRASEAGSSAPLRELAASIVRGAAPDYVEVDGMLVLNQKCVRNGWVDTDRGRFSRRTPSSDRVLRRDDVLINSTGLGTLGRVARWTRDDLSATVDSHVTIVRFDESLVDPVCAGIALLEFESKIEDLAEGSTGQTELRRELLGSLKVQLPTLPVQRNLRSELRRLDDLALMKHKETNVLRAVRDELLPLLVSGKIRVKDAEQAVGDVM